MPDAEMDAATIVASKASRRKCPFCAVCSFSWWFEDPSQFLLFFATVVSITGAVAVGALLWGRYKLDSRQYYGAHGIGQSLTWGVLVVSGALIAKFLKDHKWRTAVHTAIQSFSVLITWPIVYLSYQVHSERSMMERLRYPHAAVGYGIVVVSSVQALLGQLLSGGPKIPFTRIRLSRWWMMANSTRSRILLLHKWLALVLCPVALGQIGYGIYVLGYFVLVNNRTMLVTGFSAYGLLLLCICAACLGLLRWNFAKRTSDVSASVPQGLASGTSVSLQQMPDDLLSDYETPVTPSGLGSDHDCAFSPHKI